MGQADIYRTKATELTRELASTKSLRESAKIRRERDTYIMLANSEDWLDGKITGDKSMSNPVYPVHFQRRFEQQWATRLAAASAVKSAKLRKNVVKLPRRQMTIETNPVVKKQANHA